jgi:hypothetical protein
MRLVPVMPVIPLVPVMPVIPLVPVMPVILLVSMIFLMLLVRVVCKDGSCNTKPADPHQDQEPCDVSSHG